VSEYDQAAGGSEEPGFIVRRLQEELRDTTLGGDVDDDEPTDNELWGDRTFGTIEVTFPAGVTAAADSMVSPSDVATGARTRFIAAAERALVERRAEHGLLPVVLRTARERAGLEHQDVELGEFADRVTSDQLESGDTPVTISTSPELIARWISAVPVNHASALSALRRSLHAAGPGELQLAAGTVDRPASVDEYVDHVRLLLEEVQ